MIAQLAAALAAEASAGGITTGGQILIVLVPATAAVLVAFIQFGRPAANSRRAADAAETAAQQTEATGNGYAKDTKESLRELITSMRELRADVGGLRGDHRDLSRRVDHIGRRLDHHIEGDNT